MILRWLCRTLNPNSAIPKGSIYASYLPRWKRKCHALIIKTCSIQFSAPLLYKWISETGLSAPNRINLNVLYVCPLDLSAAVNCQEPTTGCA